MYTKEQLQRYPYFEDLLEEAGAEALLDPLTGVISRAYILGYVNSLIADNTPFSFAILDLDNFKFINDTYGHHVGDEVLIRVTTDLCGYIDGFGLIGRYGGDELLIVDLRDISYEDKKSFFAGIYEGAVLRKNIALESCSPFITGTVGCATFPDDAQDYDTLFSLIDKTLYRGKRKGRNCHIIYVESKHKDIKIRQIAGHGVYISLHNLIRQFELVPGLANKLHSIMPLLIEDLHITDLYYAGKNGVMKAVRNPRISADIHDVTQLMSDDLYSSNSIDGVGANCPVFYGVLKSMEIETVLVVRVGMDMETDGYLICAEPHSKRNWQEDQCAIMYFLAKLIAARIRIDGETL